MTESSHLSTWEQEEYVMQERTPQMVRHLGECAGCRAAVERLEQGLRVFRSAATEWTTESLARRSQASMRMPARWSFSGRWAFAAMVPLLLLVLALFSLPRLRTPVAPAAQISDDALLEQVDEQLSVAVPSSMESLTHLVSTDNGKSAGGGSQPSVQTN